MGQDRDRGRFVPYLSEPFNVYVFYGFICGYVDCCRRSGGRDITGAAFFAWLRDIRHDNPPEGWHEKFLRDCGGDHRAAINLLIDRVEEYLKLNPSALSR